MRNKRAEKNSRERGQSLVELAVTLTFMLILLAGMVDLGTAFFIMVQLNDAATEGAAYASLHPTETAVITNRALTSATDPLDLTDPANGITVGISTQSTHSVPCEGDRVTVSVSYDYAIQMPFMTAILGRDTVTLTGSVTDTILTPICP